MDVKALLTRARRDKPVRPPADAPDQAVASTNPLESDVGHALWPRFHELVRTQKPAVALEVGARARSGNVYRDWLPESCRYIGFDVHDGPNVDMVGDAHRLSEHLAPNSVDTCWSISTFEHLAMPWLVAIELNKVLTTGGLLYAQSHQTWPVHDAPWDFWRFSKYAWATMFNAHTGFEIVVAEMGEPASVRAHHLHPPTIGLDEQPAYLLSAVIARKVGETALRWDVPVAEILDGSDYPTT